MKQYLFIDPKTIVLRDRFVSAFRMDAQDLKNVQKSICENGWDKDREVLLARIVPNPQEICSQEITGKEFLTDGHTRRQGAINEGKIRITYYVKEFISEDSAFAYIKSLQFNRRNLSDRDKVVLIQSHAGYDNAKNKKQFIAQLLHISERSAAKYMTILKDPEKLRAVLDDKETVNSAQVLKKERTKSKTLEFVEKAAKEIALEEIDAGEIEVLRELLKSISKKLRG